MSGAGAFVLTDDMPVERQTVWLRLEEPTPTEWVEATIARRAGSRKVGLDFAKHCPYDVFKVATRGAAHRGRPAGIRGWVLEVGTAPTKSSTTSVLPEAYRHAGDSDRPDRAADRLFPGRFDDSSYSF